MAPLSDARVDQRRTERLTLSRITVDDLDALTALHADPANYTHRPDVAHTPAEARTLVRGMVQNWARDGIGYWVARLDGELVGVAGISPTMLAAQTCWNLYYRFTAPARGRGLAGEAVRAAVAVGAELAPGRPVLVRTRPTNASARRLAERLGLQRRPTFDADGFVVYVTPGFAPEA